MPFLTRIFLGMFHHGVRLHPICKVDGRHGHDGKYYPYELTTKGEGGGEGSR